MSLPHEAYAGLVSRLVALAIDIAVVTVGAAVAIGLAIGAHRCFSVRPGLGGPIASGAIALLFVVYFSAFWWIAGQTPGGMTPGHRGPAPRRGPLRLPRSLLRALIGLAFAPLWLIGMALVLVDDRRRGLIDLASLSRSRCQARTFAF